MEFAQVHFSKYHDTCHMEEIRQLMGTMVWIKKLESYPCPGLINEVKLLQDIIDTFTREFCIKNGMSETCPLETT